MADLTIALKIVGENLAGGALSDVTQSLQRVGGAAEAAQKVFPAVAVAAAGMTAGLVSTVKVAADFEQQMSAVKAVMSPGEVAEFGGALQDLARTMGRDTAFTAMSAAEGIEELVKAGISAQDVLGGAGEAALALAAAGGVSLPEAAAVAANAMNAFKIQAGDLSTVVDTLAGAANASAADVSDLQLGLSQVSAVAATVGFSLEDTATALALFSNNGLRGSDAGTSLKTMLLNLQPSTKAQNAEFKRLGLFAVDGAAAMEKLTGVLATSERGQAEWTAAMKKGASGPEALFDALEKTGAVAEGLNYEQWASQVGVAGNAFFDASGSVRSMSEVAGTLQTSMEGLTDAQRLASLEVLFGSDAIRAGAILAREGAEGFNELTGAIRKTSAADVAKTRLDNLHGSLEALGGSIQDVQIGLGTALIPAIRLGATALTNLANVFGSLSPQMQSVVAIGAAVTTGVTVLTAAGLGLLALLPALTAGFAAVGVIATTVAAIFTGPVLLAIGAVVAAGALLTAAWTQNWGDIQGKTAAVWDFLSTQVFGPIAAELGRFGTQVLPELTAAWESMSTKVQAVWAFLVDTFLMPKLAAFGREWEAHHATIGEVLAAAWNLISMTVRVAWELVQGIIIAGLRVLQGDWAGAWQAIGDALGAAWQVIQDTLAADFQRMLESVVSWGHQAWEAMRAAGDLMVEGIRSGLSSIGDAILSPLRGAISAAEELLRNFRPSLPEIRMPSLPGRGAGTGGPPVVGGDAGASNEGALQWATRNLGSQSWNWLCQKFVENAFGTSGRYASAKEAAAALMTNRGGTPPRGSLAFFAPDPSNAMFGHVGIALGGNQFISATAGGVKVDSLTDAYWGRLFQGYGLPRFAGGVRGFGGGLALVGEQGPEVAYLPPGTDVYSNRESRQLMGAGSPITVNLHVAGHVQTENDLVRSIYHGLRDLQRKGLALAS